MTDDLPALLPCPFCGGTDLQVAGGRILNQVYCDQCAAHGPARLAKRDGATESAWNRRAALAAKPTAEPANRDAARFRALLSDGHELGVFVVDEDGHPCDSISNAELAERLDDLASPLPTRPAGWRDVADGGWCTWCGCGNDVMGYAHLPNCKRPAAVSQPTEAQPAEPLRGALTELVALKDLKDWIERGIDPDSTEGRHPSEWKAKHDDYYRRKNGAWEAARKALATPPTAAQPAEPFGTGFYRDPRYGDLVPPMPEPAAAQPAGVDEAAIQDAERFRALLADGHELGVFVVDENGHVCDSISIAELRERLDEIASARRLTSATQSAEPRTDPGTPSDRT